MLGFNRLKSKKHEIRLKKDSSFEVCEAYRAVRTNLMFLLSQKSYKSVLITSSLPEEGKSTTCANLAISIAQTGKRVLIIDADMRNAKIYKIFNLVRGPGLSDVLGGFSDLKCIQESDEENLSVLTAGTVPPNPSELLASPNFSAALKMLSEHFDYIFLDSPPANLVTDAIAVSSQVDGVMVIAKYGSTQKAIFKAMLEKLEQVNANILGVVLNDVNRNKYHQQFGSGYRGKYYYSYGYMHK